MGFWDKVKKKANEAWSGADFWDNEENRVQRNNAATGRRDVYTPAAPPQKPQQTIFDRVRDVVDANSPMDVYKRTQANEAPIYAMQQKDRGIGRVSDNPWQRTTNAGRAAIEGIVESPKIIGEGLAYAYSDDIKNAEKAMSNLQDNQAQQIALAGRKLQDPTLSPEEHERWFKYINQVYPESIQTNQEVKEHVAKKLDATNPTKMAAATADVAFNVLTAGVGTAGVQGVKAAGKQAAKEAIERGVKEGSKQAAKEAFKASTKELGKQSLKTAAVSAPSGGFGTVAVNPDATAKDVAFGTAVAGAMGAAFPIAGVAAAPVTRAAGRVINKTVGKTAGKVVKAVDKNLPGSEARIDTRYYKARVDEANKLIEQYYKQLSRETNPKNARQIAFGLQHVRQLRDEAVENLNKANQGLIGKSRAGSNPLRERIDELSQLGAEHQRVLKTEKNPYRRSTLQKRYRTIESERQALTKQLKNPIPDGQGGWLGGLNAKEILKYKRELFETPVGRRFEGSDEKLVATGIKNSAARTTKVTELIQHPELFEAYPQLKDYTITFRSMPAHHGGSHRASTKTITLNRNRPANARLQTLMHELNHAIDNIEGKNAAGGPGDARLAEIVAERANTTDMRSNFKIRRLRDSWRKTIEEALEANKQGNSARHNKLRATAKELEDQINAEFKKPDMDAIRHQAYEDYFGETSSRTVSNRLGLSDAERAKRPFMADLATDDATRLLTLDDSGNVVQVDVTPDIPAVKKGAPAPTQNNPAIHPTMKGAKISAPDGGGEFPDVTPPRTIKVTSAPDPIPEPTAPIKVTRKRAPAKPTAPPQRFDPVAIENNLRTQTSTAFLDKDMALIKVLKRMERTSGKKGLLERFYYDSGLQSRANSIANYKMATSQELQDAMRGLGKQQLKEFNEYANARAELTMAQRGMKTSKPLADLEKIVAELSEDYGDRFAHLNKFYKERAKDLLDGGIIDKKKYNQFIKSDDYIRLQRDFDDLVGRTSGTGNSYSFGKSLTSFKRKGSQRELLPADLVTFEYTQQIQKEIQRNQTATNLIDTLSEFGMTRKLSSKQAVNKNTIKRIVNGKTEIYEVDPILKNVIDNIRPYQLNGLERIIGAPARVFRAGTTALSAPFSAANYLKDQAGSAINSQDVMATHIRHPQNIFSGLYEAAKDFGIGDTNDDIWKKFIAHGGDTTQYDLTRNVRDSRMLSRELRHGQAGRGANAIMHPIKTLEDFNSITEKATRYQNFKGIYQKVLDETNDPDMALQQATVAAWQNSVDFNRAGNVGRFINLLVPYFNAGIQGTRQMGRSMTRSKTSAVATTAKAIGVVGFPLYAATAWNLSDPKRKEVYDNIKDYEKENSIIFVLPNSEQNEQGAYNVLKIPMPPGFKDMVMPGRRAMESFANQSPQEFGQMAGDLMQAVAGPFQAQSWEQFGAGLIPQVVKPFVQQKANQDFFTGSEIVPGHIENATDAEGNPIPEDQKAREWTSGTAKIIGDKLNISPIRVEKFLKDSFGAVGQYTVNTTDNALAKAGMIDEKEIGGRSAVTDITRRFTQASGEVNHKASDGSKYYNDVEEVSKNRTKPTLDRWEAIHPSKSNFLGDEINQKSIVDSGVKAGVYLQDPEVFEMDRELDARARKRGKPGNPIFDLDVNQRQTLLSLQANKNFNPGDKAMADVIEKQNPWIKEYYEKQSAYFDAIAADGGGKGSDKAPNGIRRPEPSEDVERMFDVAGQITDPKQKAQFYKDNPELTEYLAQNEDYNRAKRAYLGLPQLDRFPENAQMKALEEQYFALEDKAARKAFMAANPGLSDYWLEKNLWQLNEAGARARFEGEELDEDTVKDIMSIARSLGYGSGGGFGGGGSGGGSVRTGDPGSGVAAPSNNKPVVKGTVRIAKSKSTPGKVYVKRGGRI